MYAAGMTIMAVSVGEICENTKLAREMALMGNYESALVYYEGTVQMIHRLLITIADPTRKSKWQLPDKPDLDLASAARIVTVGSCVYAPPLHYWYKFLDNKFPGKAIKAVVIKVTTDQCIMTPVLLAAFYTFISVLERKENIFEELQAKYWKTFVANQAFWIPAKTINFIFMPRHLQVVYVACTSFIWTNVLCFIKRQKIEKPNAYLDVNTST